MDASILKALCEPNRFLLLQLMSQRGYCVRALAQKSGLSESAVSQHLKVLREAGLVVGVKRGYYTHYSPDKEAIRAVAVALSAIADAEHRPCTRPFYGCEEAGRVACKSYVPPEEREGKGKEEC